MEFIGAKLKRLREDKRLTLIDIEKATGIAASYISDLENSKKKNPGADVIVKLSKFLAIEELYFYLEDSRLPSEILPKELLEKEELLGFLMNGENTPWLLLSKEGRDSGIPIDVLHRIIEAWKTEKK